MSKTQKKHAKRVASAASKTLRNPKSSKTAKSLAGSALLQATNRSTKSGRFMDGVRKISERDRVGLIKLADR
jgi:hypothetical protein